MNTREEYFKNSGLGLLRTPEVLLAPHNPKWQDAFAYEQEYLLNSLQIPSLTLVHCGSTSIPGIYAKPILDILGGVDSIATIDDRKGVLETLGYEYKGEYGIPGRRYCTFYGADKQTTYVHLHIFEKSHYEFYKHFVFAHHLRNSKEAATEYEQLKLRLVKEKLPRSEYSAAKNEVIQKLQKQAEAQWPPDYLFEQSHSQSR